MLWRMTRVQHQHLLFLLHLHNAEIPQWCQSCQTGQAFICDFRAIAQSQLLAEHCQGWQVLNTNICYFPTIRTSSDPSMMSKLPNKSDTHLWFQSNSPEDRLWWALSRMTNAQHQHLLFSYIRHKSEIPQWCQSRQTSQTLICDFRAVAQINCGERCQGRQVLNTNICYFLASAQSEIPQWCQSCQTTQTLICDFRATGSKSIAGEHCQGWQVLNTNICYFLTSSPIWDPSMMSKSPNKSDTHLSSYHKHKPKSTVVSAVKDDKFSTPTSVILLHTLTIWDPSMMSKLPNRLDIYLWSWEHTAQVNCQWALSRTDSVVNTNICYFPSNCLSQLLRSLKDVKCSTPTSVIWQGNSLSQLQWVLSRTASVQHQHLLFLYIHFKLRSLNDVKVAKQARHSSVIS